MPTKTYDPEKLTPEQNAVIESILNMTGAEVSSEPEQKTRVWKPMEDDIYFHYDSVGTVYCATWENDGIDNRRYSCGDCYRTEEEAFFAVERNKVITELRRFAEEYNDTIDWSDPSSKKYMLYLDYSNNRVCSFDFTTMQINDLAFSSKEIAYDAIKTIGEDRLIKYYFGSYKEQE